MTPSLITVVANARTVALDSGRHLRPGEIEEVVDSPRHRRFIDEQLLSLVAHPVKKRLTRSEHKDEG